jgi:hypothetical protein
MQHAARRDLCISVDICSAARKPRLAEDAAYLLILLPTASPSNNTTNPHHTAPRKQLTWQLADVLPTEHATQHQHRRLRTHSCAGSPQSASPTVDRTALTSLLGRLTPVVWSTIVWTQKHQALPSFACGGGPGGADGMVALCVHA